LTLSLERSTLNSAYLKTICLLGYIKKFVTNKFTK
jgi:hypothetical protein